MPRPRQYDEAATDAIRIRVTPSQRRDLELVAHETGINVATLIRDAVNIYVGDIREQMVFVVQKDGPSPQ